MNSIVFGRESEVLGRFGEVGVLVWRIPYVMEHVYIRLVLLDRKIAVERLGEELKLYLWWEQRGVNEETYPRHLRKQFCQC
jgi:hypothetical protein